MTIAEKIAPLQAWHIATSIRLHFEDRLDAVKYRFKMASLTQKAFEIRKDRYHFEKLSRKHSDLNDAIWYCVANVLAGNKWIGDMNEEPFIELKAYHESMKYRFEQELKVIRDKHGNVFDELMKGSDRPPRILMAYAASEVSIHALSVIQCLTGFLNNEMKNVSDPLGLWNEHAIRVKKYAQILSRDLHVPAYRDIVISVFTST